MTTTTYPIAYGDRIYVRALKNGVKVLETTISNVADLTALVGEIRFAGRHLDGLVHLYVRNYTRGWMMDRPFKFYRDLPTPRVASGRGTAVYEGRSCPRQYSTGRFPSSQRISTIFPWDTH